MLVFDTPSCYFSSIIHFIQRIINSNTHAGEGRYMRMKTIKRIAAVILALAMVMSCDSTVNINAAKKPKLNRSSAKVYIGKTVTIKVKNGVAKAKVTWKTSNKKVAKITKKVAKGKNAKAVVKGFKKGKATISAKYKLGKKSINMKCKVTVENKEVNKQQEVPADIPQSQIPAVSEPTAEPTVKPTATPEPSEEMKELMDSIEIPYSDEIRGNITLPLSIEGASVTWKSSNPSIITDADAGEKLAGVVTRGAEDTMVTLTATITKDNETAQKNINVRVLKAPKQITEDDYEGYLFGHFTGHEGTANDEQIYFALSNDRLDFKDMNGGKPVLTSEIGEKGVRDPYICRSPEGDRFFLIATDLSIFYRGGWGQDSGRATTEGSHSLVFWESTDLVNWSEPKLIKVAPENAGMAWAPEMIYDDTTGQYIIYFASCILDSNTKNKVKPNAIYYVATRDFVNFSDPKLFIDNQTDNAQNGQAREIIDTTVIKIGDYYYSASKDGGNYEANGGIRIMKSKNLLEPESWEKVLDLDELGFDLSGTGLSKLDNSTLEGPEFFRYNKKDWSDPNVPEYGLMADQYMNGTGYLPLATTNIEDIDNSQNSWKLLSKSEYSFDKLTKRHGTIFRITKDEYERLKEAYGN